MNKLQHLRQLGKVNIKESGGYWNCSFIFTKNNLNVTIEIKKQHNYLDCLDSLYRKVTKIVDSLPEN